MTKTYLEELAETERLREQVDHLSRQVHGRHSQVMEAWGDVIDPRDSWRDEAAYFGGNGLVALSNIEDRYHGKNEPFVRSEQDLKSIRGESRLIAETAAGIGVRNNLKNYVVGSGHTLKVNDKGGNPRTPSELAKLAQYVLDECWERNAVKGVLDREWLDRGSVDGDGLLTIAPDGRGQATLRFMDPDSLVEPSNARQLEEHIGCDVPSDWSFGVHTLADDVCDIMGYHAQWNPSGSDWEYLPAPYVVHMKRNVPSNVKRGLSDFYAVRRLLPYADKLLENMAMGAAALSAIIGVREHAAGVTKAQAETMRSDLATGSYQSMTGTGARTNYYKKIRGATWIDVPKGQQYHPSPIAAGYGDTLVVVEQAILRMAGARWSMPEYMISGDASNANYSSTLVAGGPFDKSCEAEQAYLGRTLQELAWKVLAFACQVGRFGGMTIQELQRALAIATDFPSVAITDRDKETTRNQTLVDGGVMARETWASKEGLDYKQEAAAGAKVAVEALPNAQPLKSVQVGELPAGAIPGAPFDDSLKATALNGAQVASLMDLVAALAAKEIPPQTARAIIKAAFPAIEDALINAILGTLASFTPPPKEESPKATLQASTPPNPLTESTDMLAYRQRTAGRYP